MTACDHPSLYRQAHGELPESRKEAPQWKVLLYVLTANDNLWRHAARYISPDVDRFDWQAMLAHESLSAIDEALVRLAASLYGAGAPIDLDELCATLDDHNFEVAIKAIRIKCDLLRGRPAL